MCLFHTFVCVCCLFVLFLAHLFTDLLAWGGVALQKINVTLMHEQRQFIFLHNGKHCTMLGKFGEDFFFLIFDSFFCVTQSMDDAFVWLWNFVCFFLFCWYISSILALLLPSLGINITNYDKYYYKALSARFVLFM